MRQGFGPIRKFSLLAALLPIVLLSVPAVGMAALGDVLATAASDGVVTKAAATGVGGAAYTMQVIQMAEGTVIREYANTAGVVFAVSWIGPFKPDLQQLLGTYFANFRDASRPASGAAARGARRIESHGVVFQSAGRMRAFSGRAFVRQLVPAGIDVEQLP